MLARTHRDVAYFDRAVRELRTYVSLLERAGNERMRATRRTDSRRGRRA
jgi:hypothetical protein